MLKVLGNSVYRRLFTAQVVALVGTGLATVALSLLAYDIAGRNASAVLGTALAIKMVAYVGVAPVISAFGDKIPRRTLLVSMDLVRVAVALMLPFVSQVWQIYVLIFLLQAASAAFTPTFQATIPEVLPAERDYTQALSLSRLAYDLESLFSPALAAGLLTVISYNWLFTGTALGFLASAALVVSVGLPTPAPVERTGGVYAKAWHGTRLFLKTPILRAMLALDLATAAAGSMVIVNTVVLVRETLGRGAGDVSIALGAFGAGSMMAAIVLPKVLQTRTERALMLPAAFALTAVLGLFAAGSAGQIGAWSWPGLLVCWLLLGAATSVVLTPAGRLLRRSAASADLPAVFAAQFSLSHACWLITYPLAGWLAVRAGMTTAAVTLTGVALAASAAATVLWPSPRPGDISHTHADLPADHPHLINAYLVDDGVWAHAHPDVIDPRHDMWPEPSPARRRQPVADRRD